MPLLILALLFCVLLALATGIVLSLVLRYRAGTARRQGRRWIATVNIWSTAFGAGFFLLTAACLSFWNHQAFSYAFAGMLGGAVLGMLALAITRWETSGADLYYTPNRWLAFLVVFAISARLIYGWWRGLHAGGGHPFLSASGTNLSLATAGAVIGYYLAYAIGVRHRLLRHERRRA